MEYYDVRDAASASQTLNDRPLLGARLHIVRNTDVQLPRLSPTQPTDDPFVASPAAGGSSEPPTTFRAPNILPLDMQAENSGTEQDERTFLRTVEGTY